MRTYAIACQRLTADTLDWKLNLKLDSGTLNSAIVFVDTGIAISPTQQQHDMDYDLWISTHADNKAILRSE